LNEFESREVSIPPIGLAGTLRIPQGARAVVTLAHGSGSSRLSPRNMAVAEGLNARGLATLLFDLLSSEEEANQRNVFDIALLAARLNDAVHWLKRHSPVLGQALGLFGASTGAAAALVAASNLDDLVGAVVSRGGRPDLAGEALDLIRTPTLLIVGGADDGVTALNEEAFARLKGPKAIDEMDCVTDDMISSGLTVYATHHPTPASPARSGTGRRSCKAPAIAAIRDTSASPRYRQSATRASATRRTQRWPGHIQSLGPNTPDY
jgi:dienelactone hydrolase